MSWCEQPTVNGRPAHHDEEGGSAHAVEHSRILNRARTAALDYSGCASQGALRAPARRFLGVAGGMRGEQGVGDLQQRIVLGDRLDFGDVQPGAGDLAGLQGFDKGRFVDDGSARGVDNEGRGLHAGEGLGVEAVASGGIEREVHAEIVGGLQHLVDPANWTSHSSATEGST